MKSLSLALQAALHISCGLTLEFLFKDAKLELCNQLCKKWLTCTKLGVRLFKMILEQPVTVSNARAK